MLDKFLNKDKLEEGVVFWKKWFSFPGIILFILLLFSVSVLPYLFDDKIKLTDPFILLNMAFTFFAPIVTIRLLIFLLEKLIPYTKQREKS